VDRRSVAEAAAAVGDDALAGDEPGALGAKEAHGLRCRREFHPPGGHRGEMGLLDVIGDAGVALDEDEAGGATVFTVMPNGASSRAQLGVRSICADKTEPARPEIVLARTRQPVASPGQTEG
jgi:hypothetical protein